MQQINGFLKELFEYNYSCNQKLVELFSINQDISEKANRWYNHVLNAHRIWNCRIEPKHESFLPWDVHPLQEYAAIDKTNYEHSLSIVEKYDMDALIHYTNTKGEPFKNSIKDILFQIINHSTYHRGQIAIEFRNSSIEPLPTDYIIHKR